MWRTIAGTRWAVTTLEVTTGSVGVSTAASRNASAQLKLVNSVWPISARTPSVIGIATTIARVTGPQWRRSSSRSTKRPSEKRVRISAISITSTIPAEVASTETTSVSARMIPRATERTEIDRTVPRISPESAAATASSTPITRIASPKPRFMLGL